MFRSAKSATRELERKETMLSYLKDEARRLEADLEKKTILERMLGELRNIEHCLNFMISHAGEHKAEKSTRIASNSQMLGNLAAIKEESKSRDSSPSLPWKSSTNYQGSEDTASNGGFSNRARIGE